MTSYSNNIVFNNTKKNPTVPPSVTTNMIPVNSPVSSVRRALSTDDSSDEFVQVKDKKKVQT